MRPAVLALVTILSFVLAACVVAEPGRSTSSDPSAPTGPSAPAGMIVVGVGDLPPELAATLALIDAGGPFPYPQDGSTFQNREGLLPERPEGHYREYTVPTPGEDDRGARRIVTGADGERYWTADHYASFAWIAP
jgi:ribonuclease T1